MKPTTDRNTGLGGTDIAAIVGLNPYKTAFDVFAEKTGSAPARAESESMKWGKLLQKIVADEYSSESGNNIYWADNLLAHDLRPWQIGSPDGFILGVDGNNAGVLEVKTASLRTSHRWGDTGTDQVPDEYLIQVQWYLSLTGLPFADLAVLIGGQELRTYRIERNDKLIDSLLLKGEEFWTKHIVGNTPPELGASKATEAWLKQQFPESIGQLRNATDTEVTLAQVLRLALDEQKKADEKVDSLKNQLKGMIGEDIGIVGDDFQVTWKSNKPSMVTDWKKVVEVAKVDSEIIAAHTLQKPGARVLRTKFNEEE